MSGQMYGVEEGQIYIATDGSKGGCVVTDAHTYADRDDVVVQSFTAGTGMYGEPHRIDTFKLAQVRYSLVDVLPSWAEHLSPEIGSLLLGSSSPGL